MGRQEKLASKSQGELPLPFRFFFPFSSATAERDVHGTSVLQVLWYRILYI